MSDAKNDIPAKLRRYARWDNIKTPAGDQLLLAAADEIERLEILVAEANAATTKQKDAVDDRPARPVFQ